MSFVDNPIKTIVYASLATQPFSHDEILDLLATAKRNNGVHGITGMLLYHDGCFMQAIEGEPDQVDSLFDRIKKDRRHKMVIIVHEERSTRRAFADWRMGFSYLTKPDDEISGYTLEDLKGYSNFLDRPDLEFFTEKPSRVRDLLLSFRHRALNSDH